MGTTKGELFTEEQNQIAAMAKVIAHPARVAILSFLVNAKDCVNKDLVAELGLAQSTVSQHLNELKKAGLVRGTISGVNTCYCLDVEAWEMYRSTLGGFLTELNDFNTTCC